MTRFFQSPEDEERFLTELSTERRRQATLRTLVTPRMAQDAGLYADAYPWMNPEVMQSLIQAGLPPDDPRVAQIATAEAAIASETGQLDPEPAEELPTPWYETLASTVGDFFKPIIRTGLLAFNTPYEEFQALVSSLGEAALHDGEFESGGGFSLGELFSDLGNLGEDLDRFWTNYTQKAARSGGILALADFIQGREVDVGEGFMPGSYSAETMAQPGFTGGVYGQHHRDKHRLQLDGQFLTMGRLIARDVTEPGSTAYQLVSGAGDFMANIYDPVALATLGASKATRAVRTFQSPSRAAWAADNVPFAKYLVRGNRPTVQADDLRKAFLASDDGRRYIDYLANTSSMDDVLRATGWSDVKLAGHIAQTSNTDQITNMLLKNVGAVIRERPTAGRWGQAIGGAHVPFRELTEGAEFGSLFGGGARVFRSIRNVRMLGDMPRHVPLSADNLTGAARELSAWMRNARLPQEFIDDTLLELAQVRGGNHRALTQVALKAVKQVGDELLERAALIDDGGKRLVREDGIRTTVRLFEERLNATRAWDVDDVGRNINPMDGINQARIPGLDPEEIQAMPALLSDMHNTHVFLPDARDVRRLIPQFAWMQGLVTNPYWVGSVNVLDNVMSKVWKPAQLLRAAYTIRVVGEEQLRIAGMGYDSLANHPMTAIAWTLAVDPKSKLGQKLARWGARAIDPAGTRSVSGADWRDIMEFTDTLTRGSAGWRGPVNPGFLGTGNFVPVARSEGRAYFRGWADQLIHYSNDAVSRRVTAGLSDADMDSLGYAFDDAAKVWRRGDDVVSVADGQRLNDPDLVADWYFNGNGRQFLDDHASMPGRAILGQDPDAARQYLQTNYYGRLQRLTGGDSDLVETLASRRFGSLSKSDERRLAKIRDRLARDDLPSRTRSRLQAEEYELARGHIDLGRPGARRSLERVLAERFDHEGIRPRYTIAEQTIKAKGRATSTGAYDNVIEMLFDVFASTPTNMMSRSPTFRQMHWQRVSEMFGDMDAGLQRVVLENARKANIPASIVDKMEEAHRAGRAGTMFTAANSKDLRQSMQKVEFLANQFAAKGVKDLLYDLSKRNQFFDMTRLIFPFGDAWKEIISAWGGIVRKNPAVIRRAQQAIEGARAPSILPGAEPETTPGTGRGFFHPGPFGEEVFTYPTKFAGKLLGAFGAATGWGAAERTGDLLAGDAGLELTGRAQGLNIATASILPGFGPVFQLPASWLIPHTPGTEDLREFLMPFGAPKGDDPGTQVWDILLPAWMEKAWAAAVNNPDSNAAYGNTIMHTMRALSATGRYDFRDRADAERLLEDARSTARTIYMIRGLAQFGAPTGPQTEWTSQDLAGNVLPTAALAEDLRNTVRNEYNGDWEGGLADWLLRYGVDNILAVVPMTREVVDRPVTDYADRWVRSHGEQSEKFPTTIGYFAPDPANDAFDYQAYITTIEQGFRERIDDTEMTMLANDMLGRMQWENAKQLAEARPSPQMSLWLARIKNQLAEQYPGFDSWAARKSRERRPRVDNLISELRLAVQDPELAATDAGKGTIKYLSALEVAQAMAERTPGVTRYQQAKAARGIRDWLRSVANQIMSENPDFARMWEDVFRRELTEDEI